MATNAALYIDEIDRNGFCVVPGAFAPEKTGPALDYLSNYYRQGNLDPETGSAQLNLGDDQIVWNLQNKDILFCDFLFGSPVIDEVLKAFLNDEWYKELPADGPNYILHTYMARSGGHAPLRLHIDSLMPCIGPFTTAISVLVCLERQDLDNGCTVVVPGSHKSGQYVKPEDRARAIPVPANAGDAIVLDSRIWHGSAPNDSGRSRWLLVATFIRWWLKQGFNIPGNLPQDIYAQLTPSQKVVMGYCSIPPEDESERHSAKTGLASLKPDVGAYR